ncbi:hypothetical protein FNV43_RR14142 [Rhamnella rubrinervis]|uniref:Uncharacterized protein n=1 Tax=Rhamnella rubrinervis TaxID=2594499 RepID=A0A8K0H2N7_9ROSA|nr:hypothetical protein FNV43_RR14142 [Rhamnella rubrinervis]
MAWWWVVVATTSPLWPSMGLLKALSVDPPMAYWTGGGHHQPPPGISQIRLHLQICILLFETILKDLSDIGLRQMIYGHEMILQTELMCCLVRFPRESGLEHDFKLGHEMILQTGLTYCLVRFAHELGLEYDLKVMKRCFKLDSRAVSSNLHLIKQLQKMIENDSVALVVAHHQAVDGQPLGQPTACWLPPTGQVESGRIGHIRPSDDWIRRSNGRIWLDWPYPTIGRWDLTIQLSDLVGLDISDHRTVGSDDPTVGCGRIGQIRPSDGRIQQSNRQIWSNMAYLSIEQSDPIIQRSNLIGSTISDHQIGAVWEMNLKG